MIHTLHWRIFYHRKQFSRIEHLNITFKNDLLFILNFVP